jgi:hypothetical protein
MRKRINLSVSEETYLELTKVQEEYGFKNVCEVAATLLSLFLKRVRKVEETDPLPEDDEQTIREMFEEYGEWEPRPQAGHAPQVRRPRRK